jgi:hypothetical protein
MRVVKTRKYSSNGYRTVGPKLKKSIPKVFKISSRFKPFVLVMRLITVIITGSKIVINTFAKPIDTVPIVES